MGRLAIATPALSDAATIAAIGNEIATLPASNLLTPALSEQWRTSGLSSMFVELDLGSASAVDLVALMGTNASSSATWQVRAAATQGALTSAPGYDSGSLTHWPQTSLGEWDSTYAILSLIGAAETYRWWRIDVTDSGNADGYYQAGRLYLARAWQPSENYDVGASHRWVSESEDSVSLGGQVWVDERPSRRVWEGRLSHLTESEALVTVADLQRLRGQKGDILLLEDPESSLLQELTVYGRLVDVQPIVRRRTKRYQTRLRVEELL